VFLSSAGETVLRIVQIVNSLSGGGAERLAADLHEEYLRMGHDSRILALSGPSAGEFSVSAGYSTPYHPLASEKTAEFFRKTCPDADAVHVHLFPALLSIPGALRRKGYSGGIVATEHSTSNRRRGSLWGSLVDNFTYRGYQRVVCISSAVEESLVRWKPALSGKTVVIPNGVRLDRFFQDARTGFHSPPVILSVGRLTPAKNYSAALKAVRQLTEGNCKPFKWVIAGDGSMRKELETSAADLVSRGVVEFLGNRDDIPVLMEKADVLFMPSMWEGFGIAAVEAMASGLPVVASDIPGLREVVSAGAGILVDPDSEQEQAEALEALLRDESRSLSMGILGRRHASLFSIGTCAERHIELFREMNLRGER
jgi:glycosyltransferase involved in cell wall biosynthesis